jgi:hypothetical protein
MLYLIMLYQVPHAAQQCISGKCTLKLSSAFPAFETLIKHWKLLAQHVPYCDPLVQIGLSWADKYDERMGTTDAYAVTMCESVNIF